MKSIRFELYVVDTFWGFTWAYFIISSSVAIELILELKVDFGNLTGIIVNGSKDWIQIELRICSVGWYIPKKFSLLPVFNVFNQIGGLTNLEMNSDNNPKSPYLL